MKKVQTPLFQGITENEWNEMQNCSCMRQQSFEKNELIFRMGESVREIGIVLTGSVNICLLYTSPSPRDRTRSRMPSSA